MIQTHAVVRLVRLSPATWFRSERKTTCQKKSRALDLSDSWTYKHHCVRMKDQNKYISSCTCAENMSQRVQALEKLRSTIFDSLFFRLVYVGDNKVKIVYNFARKVPLRSKKSFHTTIKASAIKIKANNQRSTKLLAPELCGLRNLESTSSFRPVHVLLLRPTYRACTSWS